MPHVDHIDIAPPALPRDLPELRAIFAEYMDSLDIDLSYQNAAAELASLPGNYAPPKGAILMARDAGHRLLGCVALRPLAQAGAGEIKRLYVRPAARGSALGRRLAEAVIELAKTAGYTSIFLDTLPAMLAARALYAALGFYEVAPYYDSPIAGTIFMRCDL